ncbi:MAG: 16S rRNA (uracil(1498)-N(3))-methyltransferase [Proteobacteria bacterium]|nr:16S rRNA (uracil(1498)-N(3))-methyltransferase [Pseudomonadota bacterium]
MSRRFLAPRLGSLGDHIALDAATSHHVLTVCLTPRGTPVRLFFAGQECDGVLVDGTDGVAVVEVTSAPRLVPTGGERMLLIGLPKKPAWERILRMGTELGVTRFAPFHARHSIAKGDKLERWARICEEAARQCERANVPRIEAPRPLASWLAEDLPETRLVCSPRATEPLGPTGDAVLLVGPEGGLHDDEVALAIEHGFHTVSLGSTVLRADTAVVAALARLS